MIRLENPLHQKDVHNDFLYIQFPTIEEIADEWNRNVSSRARELDSENDYTYFNIILPNLKRLLHSFTNKGDRLIDVGCGLGHLTKLLKDWGYDPRGIDIAKDAVEHARRKYSAIQFEVQSISDYSKEHQQSFDVCMANMVLHNIVDLDINLRAIKNLLRKNGVVIATVPDPRYWFPSRHYASHYNFEYNANRAYRVPFQIRGGEVHPSSVTYIHRPLKMYNDLICESGFDIVSSENPTDTNNQRVKDLLFCVWRKK